MQDHIQFPRLHEVMFAPIVQTRKLRPPPPKLRDLSKVIEDQEVNWG